MTKSAGRTYIFSAFVFHTGTGELTRAGRRLRIPDQEARLLSLLLENPGAMVTRDQLREALWPDGEVLDYDRSINRAVSQLRAILRDHSSKAKELIETLPKRGYRFSGPVEEMGSTEADTSPNRAETTTTQQFPHEKSRPTVIDRESEVQLVPTVSRGVPGGRPARWLGYILAGVTVVAAAAGIWLISRDRAGANAPISLGIVPLESSGEGAQALAEGFRLNLADVLSQSPEVETRSVHAFDHFGPDESQTLQRARQMRIDALLFGKFTVSGNICQLRLELVRSKDGVHLSSLLYSGSKEELASISDRVEQDIFVRLHPKGKAQGLSQGRPASPKAYAAYLNGRLYLQQWTDESLNKAVASFDEALREDPSYARADAGMASAYFVLAQHAARKPDEALEQARKFATQALALDPTLAEAHAILGEVMLTRDWDFIRAEEQLNQAVELDPNHAIYHQWLSILLGVERKYDQALAEIDKAHAANPDWAPLYMTEIFLAASGGQTARADRAADLLLKKMPDWSLAHEQYALSLWSEGKYQQAISQWRQAAVLEKNTDRVLLEDEGANALRQGGVKAYAQLCLKAIRSHRGVSHEEQDFIPAQWYAYAGDYDHALTELSVMVQQHSPNALQIADDPAYRPLAHDSRFLQLLRQIGVPTTLFVTATR